MATILPDIRKILETKLASIVGLPEVAWENLEYEPTTGTSWIKPKLIQTIRRPICAGTNPQQYYQGLLIFSCNTPTNEGPSASDALAALLVEAFEVNTKHTDGTYTVSIRRAEQSQGTKEGSWYKTIVQISWFTYD